MVWYDCGTRWVSDCGQYGIKLGDDGKYHVIAVYWNGSKRYWPENAHDTLEEAKASCEQ